MHVYNYLHTSRINYFTLKSTKNWHKLNWKASLMFMAES